MVGRRRSLVHSALRKAILAASPPALRREMLDLTASLVEEDAGLAKDRRRAKDAELSHPCRCCGGRMLIIETFQRGASPHAKLPPLSPTGAIFVLLAKPR
jgi:hypothetical protein